MNLSEPYKHKYLKIVGDNARTVKLIADDGAHIADIELNTPAYSGLNAGVMSMAPTQPTMLTQSGTLSAADILDGTGDVIATLTIGTADSYADLRLPTLDTTVFQGAMFSIQNWSIS